MKKTYMRPEGTVIQLCMEQHILDGSITANTSKAEAQDDVEFESAAKGWGSESWSERRSSGLSSKLEHKWGRCVPHRGKRGLHSLCPGARGVAPIGVFWGWGA